MEKYTALLEEHKEHNAKLVPFAGWLMPLQYRGIVQEHNAVRKYAGLFDVSHMGEFLIKGKDALAFLNSIVPQDVLSLENNKMLYCQFTNQQGGIIDDLMTYKISDSEILLVVNAARLTVDWMFINNHKNNFDVELTNISDDYSLIALQGPNASKIMEDSGFVDQPQFMHFAKTIFANVEALISRSGYTGEDGFEIMVKNQDAVKIWKLLLEKGKNYNLEPIGLGARDTLRLESALLLYGNDMDEKTTPIEAGLSWSVPKDKKEDYLGKEKIFAQIQNGTEKKLIGYEMIDRAIARSHDLIFKDGKQIGIVTSGTMSPTTRISFGLGYISDTSLSIGDTIDIKVRGKNYQAKIVKRPFVKKHTK